MTFRNGKGRFVLAASLLLTVPALVSGCGASLLQPKGPIGESELFVIGIGFALMLIVVVPVVVMAFWFPRRYKASSPKDYDPNWSHSRRIDLVIWSVPAIIVTALAIVAWHETHRLDPFEPIASNVAPLPVEVVSMDWKWLFIYPEQGVATVNQLVIPINVPVRFTLTSDSVVSSFFIPQLGSQIYAMAGMKSRLHLLANEAGIYYGQNEQFSGTGFEQMRFKVTAAPQQEFEDWARKARLSGEKLNFARLEELRKPGISQPASFSSIQPGIFDLIASGHGRGSPTATNKPVAAEAH